MGIFDRLFNLLGDSDALPKNKPSTLPEDHGLHKEKFKVIGMTYHSASISRLQAANPDWRTAKKKILGTDLVGQKIYHYSYINKPVDLKVDTSNRYGKDRIMVLIAGEHVGYLPEEDSVHVGEILKFASVKYITASVSGGDYRTVFADGTDLKNSDPLSAEIRVGYSVK